jgi:phenylpropionate dioxygenase-like ring-hydroxylating dioxygenase large terminal subunit
MSPLADRLRDTRIKLGRRIVEHIRHGTSDLAPDAMVNPIEVYLDPARHAAERDVLFRKTPLVACLSKDLAEPGSYRTFDETGVPIVITRGQDGKVRAFLNICTHRGARLVRQETGKARLLTCWFHGWSFSADDGKLAAVPEAERFCNGLEYSNHLISVPADERCGLVFVQCTPGSVMDLDAHLGSFAAELELLDLGRAERVKDGVLPVASNWKYALDTYGEGYHFAALHKETLAPYFRNDITIYDRFGPHHRVMFVERGMADWLDLPEDQWGAEHRLGGIHYIFPNTILFAGSVSPGKGYYTLFRHFTGDTPGETKTYKAIFAPKGVSSEAYRDEVSAAFDATAHVVQSEDYVVSAEGYRNLQNLPAGSSVIYGRQEIALQYQHLALAEAIGMPLPAASIKRAAE